MFSKQIKKIEGINPKNMFKELKGQSVPISDSEKIKILDANDEEFKFERSLEDDELTYFGNWLKAETQKYIRAELLRK